MFYIYIYLVGAFNPSEKYESQLGLLFPINGKKNMFQTTNQMCSTKWECEDARKEPNNVKKDIVPLPSLYNRVILALNTFLNP